MDLEKTYQTDELEFILNEDGKSYSVGIREDKKDIVSIEIPDVVNELPVTIIREEGFSLCKSLIAIIIPDTIESIEGYAFWYCNSLTFIKIPENVTSIGYQAFYGCKALEKIVLPKSVVDIGDEAFGDCSSLRNCFYNGTIEEFKLIKINAPLNNDEDGGFFIDFDKVYFYSELCPENIGKYWHYDGANYIVWSNEEIENAFNEHLKNESNEVETNSVKTSEENKTTDETKIENKPDSNTSKKDKPVKQRSAIAEILEYLFQCIALFAPLASLTMLAIFVVQNEMQLKFKDVKFVVYFFWPFFIFVILLVFIFLVVAINSWRTRKMKGVRITTCFALVIAVSLYLGKYWLSKTYVEPNFSSFSILNVSATGKLSYINNETYYTEIDLVFENKIDKYINTVDGWIGLYSNGALIKDETATFGEFQLYPGSTRTTVLKFEEDSPDSVLYNISYDELEIRWKPLKISIESVGHLEWNEKPTNIKTIPESTDINDIALNSFKNNVSDDVIIPNNYGTIVKEETAIIKSYYDSSKHQGYYAKFEIDNYYSKVFIGNYVTKLLLNGYTTRYQSPGAFEFIKNNTVIVFENLYKVQEKVEGTMGTYRIYYYFYLCAFTI